ncbi:MAG: hypothetical protein N4A50_05120 [Vallitalea sp.]|jgi:hypothetical protein|nr:hypothetical protein [Vallitalea sp.]
MLEELKSVLSSSNLEYIVLTGVTSIENGFTVQAYNELFLLIQQIVTK